MKISHDKFPFYDECVRAFDISPRTVFTYGDTIYKSPNCEISPDLLAHEQVHSIQQERMGKDLWWKTYLVNPEFRLSQEVPAYQEQYKHFKGNNRETNAKFLHKIASDLSGKTYGNIINYYKALKIIKNA